MSVKIQIIKTLNGWAPSNDESKKYHNKFNIGDIYHMVVSRFQDQRTIELNALYWCVLGVVIENQEKYINTEQLHYIIKKCLLPIETVYNPVTKITEERVASTAFDNMKNEPFKAYFKDSIEFIKRYVLPGVTEYELIEAACQRMCLRAENRDWITGNYGG